MCPEELLKKDLTGKCIVVTGANSGIGLVTTKQLAKQGAVVVMGCRRVSAGEEEADKIRKELPDAKIVNDAIVKKVRHKESLTQKEQDKVNELRILVLSRKHFQNDAAISGFEQTCHDV